MMGTSSTCVHRDRVNRVTVGSLQNPYLSRRQRRTPSCQTTYSTTVTISYSTALDLDHCGTTQ